jgi:phage host-nuclease inhibitor protein Gam
MSERRLYESIKYTFDAEEVRELGAGLAREAQHVFDLRSEKANVVAEYAASMKAAEKRVADLTQKINNGYELREVECLVLLETPRPGMKRIVRTDNNETIREEAMTVAEMQQGFGFGESVE